MPAVTRVGDKCTGHDNCPTVTLSSGSSTVMVKGKACGRIGDSYQVHGCTVHVTHTPHISSGNSKVLVNGKAIACIGDSVDCGGAVAEGASNIIVGESDYLQDCLNIGAFACMRADFEHKYDDNATEEDKQEQKELEDILLYTPEIAQNVSENKENKNDKIGWHYLSLMLRRWFLGNAYSIDKQPQDLTLPSEPFFIDIDWLLSYDYAKDELLKFVYPYSSNLLNDKTKNEIVKILKRSPVWNTGGEFDFTKSEWHELEKNYFTYYAVNENPTIELDGLLASLAGFTFRALASGKITLNSDSSRTILIDKIGIFAHDTFNFEIDSFFFNNELAYWSKIDVDVKTYPWSNYINLDNWDFQNFRKKYKKGMDFLVLSNVKIIDAVNEDFIYKE